MTSAIGSVPPTTPDLDALRGIPCSTCGTATGDDIVIQFDMFNQATAQCRACYIAMRERELEVGS